MGSPICNRELQDCGEELNESIRQKLEDHIHGIPSARTETEMYRAVSIVFTLASLLTANDENEVLIFSPNAPCSSQGLRADSLNSRPDLVAFFVSREAAKRYAKGEDDFERLSDGGNFFAHSTQRPICAMFADKRTTQPTEKLHYDSEYETAENGSRRATRRTELIPGFQRYLMLPSRHRSASYFQYVFIFSNDGFTLVSTGLDERPIWQGISWTSSNCIQKLCACIQLIQNEALRHTHPSVPKLTELVRVNGRALGLYSATVGGRRFRLLPIFTGSGDDRKPFVCLAVAEDNRKDVRLFKYSWYSKTRDQLECAVLEKLRDVPGIVHTDEELSLNGIGTNEESGRTQSLLVLKTIAYPLCACETVLEFLEAMYDLLEVLRYLVQEKKFLHRDVSWANVLVKPFEHGEGNPSRITSQAAPVQQEDGGEGIPHTYRFISDVLNEDKYIDYMDYWAPSNQLTRRRVRIALADFDHATDLNTDNEDDLKDATGTPMFMADDILNARGWDWMNTKSGPGDLFFKETINAVLGSCVDKYADENEQAEWDNFYMNGIDQLKWAMIPNSDDDDDILQQSFKHGAVHDAESVFYICVLFFVRMWPFGKEVKDSERERLEISRGKLFEKLLIKKPGDNVELTSVLKRELPNNLGFDARLEPFSRMLKTIRAYLKIPWYNVASTRRDERYEFHLHDFMQRLFLKEIKRMRESGDHIKLARTPFPVRTAYQFSQESTSSSTKRRRGDAKDSYSSRSEKRARLVSDYTVHATSGERREGRFSSLKACDVSKTILDRTERMPPDEKETDQFPDEFWEIYRWKIKERSWLSSDPLYR